MNKQIKDIAASAGLRRWGDFGMKRWEGPTVDAITDGDLEKFAELIVEECVKVIANGGYRTTPFGKKHPLLPHEIATMVKEHFEDSK